MLSVVAPTLWHLAHHLRGPLLWSSRPRLESTAVKVSPALGMSCPDDPRSRPSSPPSSPPKELHTSAGPSDVPLPRQPAPPRMPTFGEVTIDQEDRGKDGLCPKDQSLVQLYLAGCNHYWNMMPDLADSCYRHAAADEEVWGAVRHLIVFAGYAPCLAATITLRQKGMLRGQCPGKIGGAPGDAFELVYDKVTDKVRDKLYDWDPVLSEYIRLHLYGDVYSSPGLSMRQKQMLTVSFLGEANMHDQLYTHLIAALRFGASKGACEHALKIGFQMSPRPNIILQPIQRGAKRALEQAYQKYLKQAPDQPPESPSVTLPEPQSVRIPERPPRLEQGDK